MIPTPSGHQSTGTGAEYSSRAGIWPSRPLHSCWLCVVSALLLVLILQSSVIAQDQLDVAIHISYEYGVPLAIERYPGVANRFGFEGFGRSQNHTFLFQGELAAPGLLLDRYRAIFRLGMALSSGSFISDEYAATNVVDRITNAPDASTNRFTIRTSESMLRLEALAAFEPLSRMRITVGPWFGLRVSGSVIQTEDLVRPSTVFFPVEQDTTRLISAGSELRSNPFRGGAVIAVGTPVNLVPGIILQPEAHARVDLESLWRGLGIRSLSGGVGLGISFAPDVTIPDAPPVVVVDSATLVSLPVTNRLSVELYNADATAAGRKIAPVYVGRTHHRTWLSISPLVLFERGSDTLTAAYQSAGTSGNGTTDDETQAPIGGETTFEVLAERLREIPDGTITLAGSTGAGEPAVLAARRADQVRRYLVDSFDITPAKIRVTTTPRRSTGNGSFARSVEIIPSDPRLLAPLFSQRITRDYSGPRLGMRRSIESPGSVRSWSVTIRQGAAEIARYSSGNEPPEQIDAVFRINSVAADSSITPLVAELEVIDLKGEASIVRDELPLRLAGRTEDRDVRSWLFLDPAVGGSTTTINNALLSSIISATRDGARITIVGGERGARSGWGANMLAEKILAALNKAGVEPAEIHITTDRSAARFPGALPDDVVHANAVGVTVRQRVVE